MVLDAVEAPSLGIEGAKLRWILIRLPPELTGGSAPRYAAESGKVLGGIGGTLARYRLTQGGIGGEQIHVGKGRALIQIRFCFKRCGHGSPPHCDCPSLSRGYVPRNKNEGARNSALEMNNAA